MLKRWTPENRYTDVPALKTVSNSWNSNSTRNLFNNSYLRMKNITLSYNFPLPMIKKINLSSLQLFVKADNLLTVSGNQGLDPEQKIYRLYASNYIPRNFLIGKDGKVISATIGYEAPEFDELILLIERQLNSAN